MTAGTASPHKSTLQKAPSSLGTLKVLSEVGGARKRGTQRPAPEASSPHMPLIDACGARRDRPGSREGGGTFGLPGSETAEEARACNECSFSPTSSSQAPDAGFPLASKQALRALNQTLFFSLILWSQVTNPRSFPFFPVSEANYIS